MPGKLITPPANLQPPVPSIFKYYATNYRGLKKSGKIVEMDFERIFIYGR